MFQIFSWFSFWLFILCAADDVYNLDDYHLQRNVKYSVGHSKQIHFLCFLLFNIFKIVILSYSAALTADTKTPESSGSDFSSLLAKSLWFSSCGFFKVIQKELKVKIQRLLYILPFLHFHASSARTENTPWLSLNT